VSPITFATREEVSDDERLPASLEDAIGTDPLADDTEDPLFSDKYRYVPRPTTSTQADLIPRANSASTYSDPAHYVLLVFSTGQILEDHYPFDWYPTRPHELLELHPYPLLVKLPRASVDEYVRPYFEANAWVLRLLDDFGSGSGRIGERLGKVTEGTDLEREKSLKKRRPKLFQWQERYIVIRDGFFQLYKDRVRIHRTT
jgi:hypothetical protein